MRRVEHPACVPRDAGAARPSARTKAKQGPSRSVGDISTSEGSVQTTSARGEIHVQAYVFEEFILGGRLRLPGPSH